MVWMPSPRFSSLPGLGIQTRRSAFALYPFKASSLANFNLWLGRNAFFPSTPKELNQWIITDKCRVVQILGMGGIGKTVLGIKLGKQIQYYFDYLIWRSLNNAPPYNFLLEDLETFFSDNQSKEFKERGILHYLRKYRCLIILDNLDSILQYKKQGQFKQGTA